MRKEMNESKTDAAHPEAGQKALIYVVDDEPLLLELASAILKPQGYRIEVYRDPESALESFASARPQPELIITDYAMHSMNGLDLLNACRRIQPRQKVLLLSGSVDEDVYCRVANKPDRFLAKPYEAKQLVAMVEGLLAA
jgi:two-component system, cell cycle sensor histidine kinase and response regulator CckA